MALERITFPKILQDIGDIFNLKRGIPKTLVELAKNPGRTVIKYLNEDRFTLVNSFRLLILMITISTFVSIQTGTFDRSLNAGFEMGQTDDSPSSKKQEVQKHMAETAKQYLSSLSFLLIPVFGLFTFLFFKSSQFNFAEHITAQAFLMSLTILFSVLFIGIEYLFPFISSNWSLPLSFIYYLWFVFYISKGKHWFKTLLAGFSSYLLSYLVFSIVFGIILMVIVLSKYGLPT
jgi:hypothetical protein